MKALTLSTGIATALCMSLSLISSSASADDMTGEALFQSMKCGKCHRTEENPKGPTLARIAETYGDEAKLLLYFEGKTEPIVEPERAKTMKPRQRKIKKLDKADKTKLAAYIIGFKKSP